MRHRALRSALLFQDRLGFREARPRLGLLIASCFTAALACGPEDSEPRPQWLVALDTDAPSPVLLDRLLVEVIDEKGAVACSDCQREFGAPEKDAEEESDGWPLSFGVATPEVQDTFFLRVRLYRGVNTDERGLPMPHTQIEHVSRLPEASGVTAVSVALTMACYGQPSSIDAMQTCDPTRGRRADVENATDNVARLKPWALAKTKPCQSEAPPGTLCVPGGAFLLGLERGFSLEASAAPYPERLTVISPFFMAETEFTVGQLRELVNAGVRVEVPTSRAVDPSCTFIDAADAANDDLPLNCVTFAQAERLCEARGLRLPTEAEWEYAAGNGALETSYPWGDHVGDECTQAVVGRAESVLVGGEGDRRCRLGSTEAVAAGPVGVSKRTNSTALGISDMAGNLAEWTKGRLGAYGELQGPEPWLLDPVGAAEGPQSFRGSHFESALLPNYLRLGSPAGGPSRTIGFRCAIGDAEVRE